MTFLKQIEKEKQLIARCEKDLVLEKLKKRGADTRRKIQLGGLVIKAGMDGFNKSVILGALADAMQLIKNDISYIALFESKGDLLFLETHLNE
jgi:hypothetical protein